MTKLPSILLPETPVLIVDDNPQYTQVLKKILEGAFGYRDITTVATTDEAYRLITAEGRFRLMFIDFRFPSGENGGALLQRLGAAGALKEKAAFLITSEPTYENARQAVSAGAIGVVAKPFDREALRQQLDKADRTLSADSAQSF